MTNKTKRNLLIGAGAFVLVFGFIPAIANPNSYKAGVTAAEQAQTTEPRSTETVPDAPQTTQEPQTETTAPASPENAQANKDATITADNSIMHQVTLVEASYNNMITLSQTEGVDVMTLYQAAKNAVAVEKLKDFSSIKCEYNADFSAYRLHASTYCMVMSDAAKRVMSALDSGKPGDVSKMQDAMRDVQGWVDSVAADRVAFLTTGGLTDDERAAQLAKSVE